MSKKLITFCDANGELHDFPIETPDYGTCSTSPATSAKVVTCEGFSLYTGAVITVKFSYINTASSMTMNVNGTGAKTVYFPGTTSMSTTATGHIQANGCYLFVYDGTYWRFCGSSNRLNYGLTLLLNGSSSTFNGASAVSKSWYAPTTAGTKGQVLKSNGSGAPTWGDADTVRTATVVVAASDASDSSKAGADYVCDGSSDSTFINAIMLTLNQTGGTVYLTEGTYNISGTIGLPSNNVILRGSGNATVLKRMFDDTSGANPVIKVTQDGCTIRDLCIDGNSSEYTYYGNKCISSTNKTNIQNVKCYNSQDGISGRNLNIINCTFENISADGIYVYGNSVIVGNYTEGQIKISGDDCICVGNIVHILAPRNCITCLGVRAIISSNIITSDNTTINPVGIALQGDFCNVSNNLIYDVHSGIRCLGVTKCNIANNVIFRGDGLSSDYTSSQYTINLNSTTTNCLVANNLMPGKNYTNEGGSTNTFANNKYN